MFEVYVGNTFKGAFGNRNMAFRLAESLEGKGLVRVDEINRYGRFEILEIN